MTITRKESGCGTTLQERPSDTRIGSTLNLTMLYGMEMGTFYYYTTRIRSMGAWYTVELVYDSVIPTSSHGAKDLENKVKKLDQIFA